MINNINIMGRLTADPEISYTSKENVSVCNFSIAVDRPHKKGEEGITDFFNCVAWRQRAEFMVNHFSKGDMIAITGTLRSEQYKDKHGENRTVIKIYVKEIHFCGRRVNHGNIPKGLEGMTNVTDEELEELSLEDDLPF